MFKHKRNMPFKTLTITEEAYKKIKMLKEENESFTDLFLRLSHEKMRGVDRFLGTAKCSPEEVKTWKKRTKEFRDSYNASSLRREKRLMKRKKELGMI
jgi:predicted CopG family antitoxin